MKKFPLFLVLFVAIGVVAFLLQAGYIGPRSAPSPQVQQLLTAARRGDLASVEQAIVDGADVNAREPSDKETALLRAARMGEIEVVRALLAAGADPDLGTRLSLTPLHVAARSGAADVISALIAGGATVDVHEDEQGLTPLHDAALELHVDAVRVLLAAEAPVPESEGKTAPEPAKPRRETHQPWKRRSGGERAFHRFLTPPKRGGG
ncbi:MAG: ankyrin repeat domain-containing protein [Planctomycetota bacterium]|jgi:ankyrin repeat protein